MGDFVRKNTQRALFLNNRDIELEEEKFPTFSFPCFYKCSGHNTHKPCSHAADQLPPPTFTLPKPINTLAPHSALQIKPMEKKII